MWFEFDLSLYVIQSYISIYRTRKLLRNLFLQQKISKIRESKAAPRIYTDNEKLGDTRKIAYLQQVILENEVDDKKKRKKKLSSCLKFAKKTTRERIELSILRLTVARLNQLGHPVIWQLRYCTELLVLRVLGQVESAKA